MEPEVATTPAPDVPDASDAPVQNQEITPVNEVED